MNRRHVLAVAVAAALPRLAVLLAEGDTILSQLVEKSERFARVFVESGTFGYIPGRPSANTQPLYAWFLSALYWVIGRDWLVVGLAQIAIAVGTALLVLQLGRRVGGPTVGLVAGLAVALHPFLVWHDVHVNREILDQPIAVGMALVALAAFERARWWHFPLLGALAGLAILGNARLVAIPLALGVYAVWRVRPRARAALGLLAVVVAAGVVVSPWLVRNEIVMGCPAITTDARALWKANNPATYDTLARGEWIDDVPNLPDGPDWPELAADKTLGGDPTEIDECAQNGYYQDLVIDFWKEHPGEKARLMVQAAGMLWSPTFSVEETSHTGLAKVGRDVVAPVYMIALYLLALLGARHVSRRFLALVLVLEVLNTLMAMVFAGTVRYRTPFDFLLAILAAVAIRHLVHALRERRGRREATA